MSDKLKDAQREVDRLEARKTELSAKLAGVQADALVLEGERAGLEQKAFGQDDLAAESALERVEAAILKNGGRARGLAAEIEAVVIALNEAQETRRKAQLEAEVIELRHLDDDIDKVQAELRPMLQRRQALVSHWDTSDGLEAQERAAEAQELQSAVEQHAGFTLTRRISSEQEAVR